MKFIIFIGYYVIAVLILEIIILVILALAYITSSEKYVKRKNIRFCILTTLIAITWPILIIYLFYLNQSNKVRIAKNRRL